MTNRVLYSPSEETGMNILFRKQLRSSIIQNEISEIGKIKPVVREVDLNADNKRFWLGQLTKIDNSTNHSMPLSANHFQI